MIYRFALAQVECTINILLNNCKQNTTSLSLLAGRTVHTCISSGTRGRGFGLGLHQHRILCVMRATMALASLHVRINAELSEPSSLGNAISTEL